MAKLSEMTIGSKIKVMAYGESGTGKTIFATGFPTPSYCFDFDGKISSAASFWREHDPERLAKIDYDAFVPSMEMGGRTLFQTFAAYVEKMEKLALEKKFPFETVIVDSMTTLSEALMQQVMNDNPGVKRMNKHTPAQQDYLIANSMFKPLIQRVLALPCNVVLIGHIKHDKDEQTGAISHRPMLSGQLADRIPIIFEEVYRTFTGKDEEGKTKYFAQTRPDGGYVARTQIRGIPDVIPLTYKAIAHYTNLKPTQGEKKNEASSNTDANQPEKQEQQAPQSRGGKKAS